MKKLISFALASATTLALAGCGVTDPIVLPKDNMGDGYTAKTALGGYWWTYVDRSGTSSVVPNTGKVDPTSTTSKELRPGFGLGNGIEELGGNLVYHVRGYVGPKPVYSAKLWETNPEPYWDGLYGDLCVDGLCKEVKYPAAGMGFGFKDHNVPLGADAIGSDGQLVKGIAFKMMLGRDHGRMSSGVDSAPIYVSAPMDVTDVPDGSFGDTYGSMYDTKTALANPEWQFPTATNAPFCTFPGTKKPDGKAVGEQKKTCFANMKTTVTPPPVAGVFTTYCVAFAAFQDPGFGGLSAVTNPVGKIAAVLPERVIKIQFDAYPPLESELTTAFDFYVDDAMLLDNAKWAEVCRGDVKVIDAVAPAAG